MMSRPRNETEADLAKERAVVADLCAIFDCEAVKLSDYLYGIDYALHARATRELHSLVEIKCYSDDIRQFAPLSLGKYEKMLRFARASRKPALFVIDTPGGLLMHTISTPENYATAILTGNPRGQNGDAEPCIPIKREQFTTIAPPRNLR